MSMGFLSAVIPIYLSETIPSEKKGSSISFVQLNSAIAGLLMYFVTYAFQLLIKDEYSFKYAWGIEALPAIALLILSFFLPESPKWLASQSKWTQAAKNLVKIKRSQNRLEAAKDHKRTHDDDRDFVLKAYTAGPEIRTCTYDKVFGKKYWKHTLIGTSSQFFVQLSSVQILKNHFLFICDICGIDGDNRAYYSSSHYMVEVLFTLIPLFLLDSARRKDCLTFGMFILGGSYLAVGVLVLVYSEKAVHGDINSPFQFEMFEEPASGVLAIFLFISAVYSSTVLSTSWLYAGEIFPGPARAKGTSICMGASWVVNTASALVLPSMLRHMGPWAFMMLSLCCFCGTIVLVTVPETRNLSEQEIESIFFNDFKPKNLLPDSEMLYSEKREDTQNEIRKILIEETTASLESVSAEVQANNIEFEDRVSSERISPKGSLYDADIRYNNQNDTSSSISHDLNHSPSTILKKFEACNRYKIEEDTHQRGKEAQEYKNSNNKAKDDNHNEFQLNTIVTTTTIDDVLDIYTSEVEDDPNSKVNSPDSYYSSNWYQTEVKEDLNQSIEESNSSTPVVVDSGNAYFHGNSEGSPKKVGITYEPTTFLQFDNLRVASRTHFIGDTNKEKYPVSSIDRSKLKGGPFISPKGIKETIAKKLHKK